MNIESHFTLLYLVNNKRGKATKGTWATYSQKVGKLKIYSQCNPTLLKTLSIVVQLVRKDLLGLEYLYEKKLSFIHYLKDTKFALNQLLVCNHCTEDKQKK